MRKWLISSIVAVIVLMLSLPFVCIAADNTSKDTFPVFPIYYASVSHVLKHDDGCFKQLISSDQMNNISEFWWGYIMRECFQYMKSQIDVFTNASNTQKDITDAMEKVKQQCAMAVIYDNWDRINLTIVKNPATECIKKKVKP
jgi:hypothetical protein